MIFHSHEWLYLILFLTGLTAGTVDAIAGGGGLISLPMLLAVGVPPHIALGTNKLQSSVGTSMAAWRYYREGLLSLKLIYKGLLFGFAGAVLGSLLGQIASAHLLEHLIPILLSLVLLYTFFSPTFGNEIHPPKIDEPVFYILFGFSLGFYDGFFGPGTGSFWVFALTFFLGYSLTQASAYAKLFNLKSNLIALFCFAIGHHVNYPLAFCMAGGQLFGGRLGASLAIKKGAKLIRPLFMIVVSITIGVLFFFHLNV